MLSLVVSLFNYTAPASRIEFKGNHRITMKLQKSALEQMT